MPKELYKDLSLKSFFDYYRIVDKKTNLINYYKDSELYQTNKRCYETWDQIRPCISCISDQCIFNKKEYFKI
jgi:hypothetical protein